MSRRTRAAERDEGTQREDEEPASALWLILGNELRHQWSHRNRKIAGLGLLALLVLQVCISALLDRNWGGPGTRPLFQLQPLVWTIFSPLGSPLPLLVPDDRYPSYPPNLALIQISHWFSLTVLQFLGPAFAARSLAPDRESGRLRELVLAGVSARSVLKAKAGAALAPLFVVLVMCALLSGGVLVGTYLAARHDAFGTLPPLPPGFPDRPRLDPFTSQVVSLAVTVVHWLSLAGLLAAVGLAVRSTRAALFACYAGAFLAHPVGQYAVSTALRSWDHWLGSYRWSLARLIVAAVEIAVADYFYRRAVRELEHPDENEAWIQVARPAMWDLTLSDPQREDPS